MCDLSTVIDPQKVLGKNDKTLGLPQYMYLIKHVDGNVSTNVAFQCVFQVFYRMLCRSQEWIENYFVLFQRAREGNLSLDEVLKRMYLQEGRAEISFASKMLATINPNVPIYDSNVLHVLHRCKLVNKKELTKSGEERLEEALSLYRQIEDFYAALEEGLRVKWCNIFDDNFPDYTSISEVKKIDFILWRQGALWRSEEDKRKKDTKKSQDLPLS